MNKKRWYTVFFLICLCLLLSSIPFNLIFNNTLMSFIANLVSKIIAIYFFFYYTKKENLPLLKLSVPNASHLFILPLFFISFSNCLVAYITKLPFNNNIDFSYLIMGAFSSLLTAVLEELLFRNLLLEEFIKQKTSKLKSLIYSSLIFGSIHLLNISSFASIPTCIIQALYTTGIGLIFGLIYIKTKNITYPIILHFLFNYINDVFVTHLYNLNWDLSFFIINISIAILVAIYGLIIYKIKFKGE